MRKMLVQLLSVLIVCLAFNPIMAFEFHSSRGIGIGKAVILSEMSPSGLLLVPSSADSILSGAVELCILRQYELKDLDEALVSVGYRFSRFTWAAGFSQFGHSELYTEKTFKLATAYNFGNASVGNAGVGVTWSHLSIDFGGGYSGLSSSTIGASLSYKRQRFLFALAADNLTSPVMKSGSPEINPQYSVFVELLGQGSYSIIAKSTFEDKQKPQFSIGQKIDVSSKASLMWSLTSEPLTYAGGLEVNIIHGLVGYYTSYHPTLGFTHCMSLSYQWWKNTNIE